VPRHTVAIWKSARQGSGLPRRWSMYLELNGDQHPVRMFRTRGAAVRAAKRILRRHARSSYRLRWRRISSNFYKGETDEE
jgi:hypothetical protein